MNNIIEEKNTSAQTIFASELDTSCNSERISQLLLERYYLKEVTPEEKLRVENTLSQSGALQTALDTLQKSDEYFWQHISPRVQIAPALMQKLSSKRKFLSRTSRRLFGSFAIAAALAFAVFMFPLLRSFNNMEEVPTDRAKGNINTELSIYIRTEDNHVFRLADESKVANGSTIQLAYRVAATGNEDHYGMIFSIDGRQVVTTHYPYRAGQSTLLVSNTTIPLGEAYILDDAPDYEVFMFVVDDEPLDMRRVLHTAEQLAGKLVLPPLGEECVFRDAFKDYEVKMITLRKE
jgi:hypothetical protein